MNKLELQIKIQEVLDRLLDSRSGGTTMASNMDYEKLRKAAIVRGKKARNVKLMKAGKVGAAVGAAVGTGALVGRGIAKRRARKAAALANKVESYLNITQEEYDDYDD